MKVYKRMVKLLLVYDLGQGFYPDIREFTDWLDEDSPEVEKKYLEAKEQYSLFHLHIEEKFVEI